MRRQLALGITALILLVLPASAGAYVIQDFAAPSTTNGIVLGPDGNFWVALENAGTVLRMSPSGATLGQYAVGSGPTSVTAGPNGTVWVSVKGDNDVARITIATGAVDRFDAAGPGCGPVAIAASDERIYYSQPGDCGGPSYVNAMTTAGVNVARFSTGRVYDLTVSGGKVFAADFDNDRVHRFSSALGAPESSTDVPGGTSPDGITVDGAGNVWVTLFGAGQVARFPSGQTGGTATVFAPTTGTMSQPFGIAAAGDGHVYVASKTAIARVTSNGTIKLFPIAEGEPQDLVAGPDGDVYFTDRALPRVRRFVSSAPRISGGAATPTATTSANVAATIDARGNATTVTFEYGPSTAYGSAVTVPANGVGPFPIGATLTGLTPGTTYHFRVRAINEEGEAPPGGDLTFTTPAPVITLKARANFSWGFKGSRTALTRIRVTDLSGGETIKITCSGKRKGCPIKAKTYKNVKKGTRSLTALFGRKKLLRTGAKIVVTITKPGAIGSTATLTIGKRKKDPKIVRRTLTS
jgi:streptogramin lyase